MRIETPAELSRDLFSQGCVAVRAVDETAIRSDTLTLLFQRDVTEC